MPTPGEQSDTAFPDQWEKHADRCWEAERENAERLNERKRQILTASAALFGLGLFSVQWLRDPHAISNIRWDFIAILMRIFLAFSLLAFGLAIAVMMLETLHSGSGSKGTASNSLHIPPDVLEKLDTYSVERAKLITFALTYDAYINLKERNAKTARRLEWAQMLFVCGISLVFVAVLAYICTSYPPI